MKASYQLPLALLLLILLLVSTFAQQARPPELSQAQLTNPQLVSLSFAKASLAGVLCDFHQTLRAYQLAIDIGTRGFGPRSLAEGAVYALRAPIHDYIGEHSQAIADYRHALSLLEEAPGRYNPAYLTVQLAYCHSLRKASLNQKALCPEKA